MSVEKAKVGWGNKKGNSVGSSHTTFCNFREKAEDAYILGLWCADSYWWASCVGLSNKDGELIRRFRRFLESKFSSKRIKFSNNHIFVNSRPLLRKFILGKRDIEKLFNRDVVAAYFAGRFDGDGCVSKNGRSDCRIVYGNKKEAEIDKKSLLRIGISNSKIYRYKSANTFCLYISRHQSVDFIEKISFYSIKVQRLVWGPRRD